MEPLGVTDKVALSLQLRYQSIIRLWILFHAPRIQILYAWKNGQRPTRAVREIKKYLTGGGHEMAKS